MIVITAQINDYREMARMLWNNSFRQHFAKTNDYELIDSYSLIKNELFRALVLTPKVARGLGSFTLGFPSKFIRVSVQKSTVARAHINRSRDDTAGYWDHPVTSVTNETEIEFVDLFDWSSYGYLDMSLVVGRICGSSEYPALVGHRVILDLRCVEIFLIADAN